MPESQSQATYLFEKYTDASAVNFIKSLPGLAEKTFESDWLDFKSGKPKGDDLKKIWSKMIGAFANSEGGVIVWGVEAKKDPTTGVDAVSGLDLVPDVDAFKTRLMELRHVACDPPVANIEIKEIPISSSNREGFVVCHIPESSNKPHRSEFSERRFYLRMGDSSRECNVSILRQLFYPKRTPRIQAVLESIKLPIKFDPRRVKAAFEIGLRNIGEFSIDDVQMGIKCEGCTMRQFILNEGRDTLDLHRLDEIISFKNSIHPQIRQSINVVVLAESQIEMQKITIGVYAKDMLPRKAILSFPLKVGESVSAECLQ